MSNHSDAEISIIAVFPLAETAPRFSLQRAAGDVKGIKVLLRAVRKNMRYTRPRCVPHGTRRRKLHAEKYGEAKVRGE
jgi:hypothetical protein